MRGVIKLAGMACAALSTSMAGASTTTYYWFGWEGDGTKLVADLFPYGSVSVTTDGTGVNAHFPVQFDGVDFSPVVADSAEPGGNGDWHVTVDLSQVPDPSKIVLGIGNFGHGTSELPGYHLEAVDRNGTPMDPSLFVQTASLDHTWLGGGGGIFNDNVDYDPLTGSWNVTTVGGGNDNDSDLAFMKLPSAVASVAAFANAPTGGDTISVVVGVPVTTSHVAPHALKVNLGKVRSGSVTSLATADEDALQVCKFIVPNQQAAPVNVEVDGTAPAGGLLQLSLSVRSRTATAGAFSQTLDVFDWTSQSYNEVEARTDTLSTVYQDVTLSVADQRASRYKRAGDGLLRGRFRIRQIGISASALWCVDVDKLDWTVVTGP